MRRSYIALTAASVLLIAAPTRAQLAGAPIEAGMAEPDNRVGNMVGPAEIVVTAPVQPPVSVDRADVTNVHATAASDTGSTKKVLRSVLANAVGGFLQALAGPAAGLVAYAIRGKDRQSTAAQAQQSAAFVQQVQVPAAVTPDAGTIVVPADAPPQLRLTWGTFIKDPDGETIGRVEDIRNNASGEIESVIVNTGSERVTLAFDTLAAVGNNGSTIVTRLRKDEIAQLASTGE